MHHPWILNVLTSQNEVMVSQAGRGPLAQPDMGLHSRTGCPRANGLSRIRRDGRRLDTYTLVLLLIIPPSPPTTVHKVDIMLFPLIHISNHL